MTEFNSGYTSFTPLTPETKSITSGFSFTRLFDFPWRKEKKGLLAQTVEEESGREDSREQSGQVQQDPDITFTTDNRNGKVEDAADVASGGQSGYGNSWSTNSSPCLPRKEKGRYRNVKTILRRLSAIAVDKKWRQTSGDFKHDFKQYWMPDEHCKECYECSGKFNTFRRRHHCRVCGQIFCSRCCSQEVPGQTMGFSGNIRVCNYCYKIVKAYLEDDIDKSLEALKEDMNKCLDDFSTSEPFGPVSNSLTTSRTSLPSFDPSLRRVGSSNSLPGIIERDLRTQISVPRNPFDAFGVTPKEAKDIKQDFLRDLWRQISDPGSKLELQSHRFRLKTYPNCFVGHELVDWLLNYGKAANRAQGVAVGQDLVDHGWIESLPATEEDVFKDEYMLYQPGKHAMPEMESQSAASRVDMDSISFSDAASSTSVNSISVADDDDETLPIWFRQISSETTDTLTEMVDSQVLGTPSLARRISSSRHLNLDQATFEPGENKAKVLGRELSLQMKLDYFEDEDENEKEVRKEIYDQTTKLSLITHVPPPPLDTYVCVEGHPFVTKKKIPKVPSVATLADDILRGIEFPKPRSDDLKDTLKDDNGEILAREGLSFAAEHHLHALLNQLIERDNLARVWKDVIMPIVLKISEKVVPDVRRDDDMDIRQYVWFKKVPVGDKPECQVISGVVFPKNVVHKKMNCFFTQPKILMLSCAIEYQRVENKLTSIDPVVLQEYEFLKNFIARVVTLKPNIVLVEKTVARVAQDMILAAGITLVHNIKSNVMENISRCTGADVLQSMEQVSRPRLGSCQQFRLHKYQLPDGGVKTLMFFEGCAPDLGCSLVLQGGDKATLKKVKATMKYLIYVAYHLKLEKKFLMDEFAMPPPLNNLLPRGCVQNETVRRAVFKIAEEDAEEDESSDNDIGGKINGNGNISKMVENGSSAKGDEMLKESKKFKDLISQVLLSSSPFCVYPLPYLLTEEGRECGCRRFIPGHLYLSRLLDNEIVGDVDANQGAAPIKEKLTNMDLIFKDPHAFTRPGVIPRPQDNITKCILSDFRARGGLVDLKTHRNFEVLHKERRKEVNIRKKGEMERLLKMEEEIQGYMSSSAKADAKPTYSQEEVEKRSDCFNPYNHQRIAVLFSSYSSESHNAPKPCISPWAVFMEYYGRNDITLGGFLERYCFRPSYICYSHNCDIEMIKHVRYFAHGNGSLYIHMRNLESPIPGYDRTILTWNWCRECKQVTPVVPLSFESWSLSFAKYLELRFYGGQYTRRATAEPCTHSLHQNHHQYFSFANMVASFKYHPIQLYEVIIPSSEVVIGKERESIEWCHDVEEFCMTAERVLIQISERINDLRNVEPGLNMIREQRVKEFHSEFQAESYHFHEFMQCLKMKVESLLKSHDVNQVPEQPDSSSPIESLNHGNQLMLQPSEISALMTGIGNMLINLKKKLCEIILAWNMRLQEYIQQEKKREKTTKMSSSPKSEDLRYMPTNVPNELGEYYPSVMPENEGSTKPEENLTYTYIYSQESKEPVSEVLLGNGAILRQTYLGTEPPKEFIASEIDDEGLAKFGKERNKEEDHCSTGDIKEQPTEGHQIESHEERMGAKNFVKDDEEFDKDRDSRDMIVDGQSALMESKKRLRIDLNTEGKPGADANVAREGEAENGRGKVGSPYMVIESLLGEESLIDDSNDGQSDSLDDSNQTTGDENALNQKDSKNAKVPKTGTNLKRTGSVQVERGSLSDINLDMERRKSISHMPSEDSCCSSESREHWMAETRDRTATVINTLESEGMPKFLKRRLASMGASDEISSHPSSVYAEDGSEADQSDLMSLQDVLDFADYDQSYVSEEEAEEDSKEFDDASEIGLGESAVDYELIRVDDELIEPISLTKELQSLNVIVDISSECPSSSSSPAQKNLEVPHKIDDIDTDLDASAQVSEFTSTQQRGKVELRHFQKRRYPPLGIQMDLADEESNRAVSSQLNFSSSKNKSAITCQDNDRKAALEKRQPLFDADHSESEDSESILSEGRKGVGGNGVDVNVTTDEPLKNEKIGWKGDGELNWNGSTNGRRLGHRRQQSAPIVHTPMKPTEDSRAACGLPGSPFELLKHIPVQNQNAMRVRSYSHGNDFDSRSGQEELTKIAEKICQVDRKNLEIDDPEEIQYDESLDETLKGQTNSSKCAKSSKDNSEVFEDENEKKVEKLKLLKGASDADESEKESVSSTNTNRRNRGHVRQFSLQYKGFGFMDNKDEVEIARSVNNESQTSQGQKKGAEKMKKIISHLLPGSNFQAVPLPFPPHEHFLLAPGDSVSVVINEKEPSSIIAYSLSSIDYFNQLSSLKKLLFGQANDDDQVKQCSLPAKKNPETLALNSTEVVLRNRRQQPRSSKRPSSWAGATSKSSFLEFQVDFQSDSNKTDNTNAASSTIGLDSRPTPPRNRMSLADQYLMSSPSLHEADVNQDSALDSPADFDDAKTDSIDGVLDDKDDLESVVSDMRQDLPDEKAGKKKDENKPSIDYNIKLQFQDNSAKFFCNVYYAEQFRRLRELVFPEGEERYIQSLSRCVFWKARGGKSGSSFSKSLDDRFVMKQMSRLEVQSFVEFAPYYFQYMDRALKEQRPTTLAKILGVYRIGFKNSQTNTTMRQDVLIMENVFYNRKVNKIFDLKGSVRSRYVHNSGKEEVLMDENLLEMICESPLFIRPHSKVVLSKAIHNDSEFLANHSVMDYSLLVGIDEVNFELVVGIIDYIRTFTWDKKLESYVKSTGILGGQGKMPTVVSPAVYRTRFTEAMHRYFLMVPDKWMGFGADLN